MKPNVSWVRFCLLGLLVTGGLYAARGPAVVRALPALQACAQLVAFDFTISALEVDAGSGGRALMAHANLAAPLLLNGQWVKPFSVKDATAAEYRVTVSITGLFVYAALYVTALLAWPSATRAEALMRLLCGLPFLAVLLLLDAPFTIAAELWNLLYAHNAPAETSKLMIFSRFLMDGGGFVLAGISAALVIGGSRRLVGRLREPAPGGAAMDEDAAAWNARRRVADPIPRG